MNGGDPLLSARHDIHDVVMRYCRGIDRLDMDLVRSAYHPDGIDNHTGFSGPIAEFIAWVEKPLRQLTGTMHIIGNHMAEIDADHAAVESYGTAVHWGEPPEDPLRNFTSGFRYVDHMEKREGRWAIVERWAVREWTRSDAGRQMPKAHAGPSPSRDDEDLIWQLRRSLGIGKA